MNPEFPLYIPSKGRYDIRKTSDYLSLCAIQHYIIVEKTEYELYLANTKNNKYVTLLILDKKYQDNYETLDDLGDTKSKGPGAARNFAWQHSIDNGFKWHWVMDDNILSFKRTNKNRQIYVSNLIRNDIPYKWRGRYNEDTILSLDILSDGFCTIQFNAFVQDKLTTQLIKGGNTGEFYAKEGTLPKSQMLADVYPEYSKVKWRFKRIHHYVDYSSFKRNKLIRKSNLDFDNIKEINNYGMKIKKINNGQK